MKKKIQCLLMLIVFLLSILCMFNKTNANELIGLMKVYKIKIKLINVDTDDYTIELIDGISNRIFDSQKGNENGEHNFTIATDMDERHLNNYSVKVKFDNGDVKDFDYINVDKLIKVDEDINDTSYNYEYSLLVKILPRSVIIGVAVMIVLGGLAALIVALKKHKKRII